MVYKNETILKETATDRSCFPSNVLSYSEAALYICESIEEGYNNLFEQIGINELAVYESTGELISYTEDTEAGKQENGKFLDKVIGFFKKILGMIKALFEKAIGAFKKVINDCKSNMYGGKITKADIDKLADQTVYGKFHDYTEFENQALNTGFATKASELINEIKNKYSSLKGSPEELFNEYNDYLASRLLGLKDDLSEGKDNDNQSSIIKNYITKTLVKDEFDVTKQWLSSGVESLQNYIFSDTSIRGLQKMYKENRKMVDDSVSTAKERMNEAKKDDSIVSFANYEYKLYHSIAQLTITADGAVIDVMKRRFSESRAIMFKVASAVKKTSKANSKEGEKQQAVNASADLFASQMAMVEGAFSW